MFLLPVQANHTVHTVVPWAQCTPCLTSVLLCSTYYFGKMENAGQFWVIFAPYILLSIDVMVKREKGKSFVQPERDQFPIQILCPILHSCTLPLVLENNIMSKDMNHFWSSL